MMEEEMSGQISGITQAFADVQQLFNNLDLDNFDYDEFVESLSPLDRAKFDITLLYANNSLFWMYLKAQGEDPGAHPIKEEMDRIKKQMYRMKEIGDRNQEFQRTRKMIDGEMVKRIVKHELWENSLKDKPRKHRTADEEEDWDEHEPGPSPPPPPSSSSMEIENPAAAEAESVENQVNKDEKSSDTTIHSKESKT